MTDVVDLPVSGPPIRGRTCGSCTACCTQVPVVVTHLISKPANTRCPLLRSSGCSIYPRRPDPCRAWSCRWLFDPLTAALARPDKLGVIVDCVPDRVMMGARSGHALQLWVDPDRRDAHRDPALRHYLNLMAETYSVPTIARWNSSEGVSLLAPALTGQPEWIEQDVTLKTGPEMARMLRAADRAAAVAP